MINYILSFILSISLSIIFLRILIKVSRKYSIYDIPVGRKNHLRPISFLGGFGIFSAFYISYGIAFPLEVSKPFYSHTLFMVLFTFLIFGLADDFLNFKANKKFALQFILIGLFLYNSNDIINISQIIGLNKEYKIFNLIFSVLLMNILVNSINLIDGSDGLAASISIIINGFLAYYFISIGDTYHSMLSCSLLGSIIGFMYFNKPPAKIFMGNGGSLFIGMILSILIFNFLNHYDNNQIFIFNQNLKIKIAFALFSIPALDLIRVMLFRVYKRRNPFIGDSNHIHHKLKAMGYKSKYIVLFIIISQIFIFTLSFVDFYKNGFIFFINSVILSYSMTILIISQIQDELKEENNRSNGIKKVEKNFEKLDKMEVIEPEKIELYN